MILGLAHRTLVGQDRVIWMRTHGQSLQRTIATRNKLTASLQREERCDSHDSRVDVIRLCLWGGICAHDLIRIRPIVLGTLLQPLLLAFVHLLFALPSPVVNERPHSRSEDTNYRIVSH